MKIKAAKIIFFGLIASCVAMAHLGEQFLVRADDIAAPTAYQIDFDDGKTFLMYPFDESGSYLKSGLYNADDLSNPIYLINTNESSRLYFYQGDLIFSADKMHFANLPWTASNFRAFDGIAIEFYYEGGLVRQIAVGELAYDSSKLSYSSSHVMWEDVRQREFDSENNILTVVALDGTVTRLSMDGEILSRSPNISLILPLSIFSSSVVIIVVFAIILIWNSRAFPRPTRQKADKVSAEYCEICGMELGEDDTFCPACGDKP